MRLAAVGDLHVGEESDTALMEGLATVDEGADALLLAGDLTRCGEPSEIKTLVDVLAELRIPVVAVLGNHDHHADRGDELVALLDGAGVTVLEGRATSLQVDGMTLGVAGTKGFGGGFPGAACAAFGEPIMKQFAGCAATMADGLERDLRSLDRVDRRVALLHYAPIRETLRGEHPEVYPFLGSYLLGEAIDRAGADLVLHGHAHLGADRGMTPGGVKVRNVAQPVIRQAYRVFDLG
jgi:Icc-related predicted phosphoesterase